jgi:type IV pilus assembly protein PilB
LSVYDRRLAQTLKRAGAIDEPRSNELLELAARDNSPFSEVLVKQGVFKEKELLGIVAREVGVPPIDLDHVHVEPELRELVTEEIAKEYLAIPIAKLAKALTVAVVDSTNVVQLDNLKLLLKCDLRICLASERAMREALRRIYHDDEQALDQLLGESENEEIDIRDQPSEVGEDVDLAEISGETSPVIKVVNHLIVNAIRDGVSDIHVEPFEKVLRVRYRQDGILRDVKSPPRSMAASIASRIKIMSGLDIAEKRKPQDGKFQVKVDGRAIDFRVSTLPVVHGEKIVLRVLDNSNLAKSLDSLGFEEQSLAELRSSIKQPYGMILITGPTGSGKSTTLYSVVRELYDVETNFVTVEDPVEYQLDGINQVPVNPKRGVTFAAALRSILRQDPDVILIGEIRDAETIEIAVKAALTGHLVLSTLHTNDSAQAITRMIDMGLDPFLVATSCVLVAAQRLCRKLCNYCAQDAKIPAERLVSLGFTPEEAAGAQLKRAVGCPRCHQGYKGRFAILETLTVTDSLKSIILEGKSAIEIKKQALKEGMITLRRAAILASLRGKTSVEEVMSVTMADDI